MNIQFGSCGRRFGFHLGSDWHNFMSLYVHLNGFQWYWDFYTGGKLYEFQSSEFDKGKYKELSLDLLGITLVFGQNDLNRVNIR